MFLFRYTQVLKWIPLRNVFVVNCLHDWSIFKSLFDHFARILQLVLQTNQPLHMYRFHFWQLGININLIDIFPFIQAFYYLFCVLFLEQRFQRWFCECIKIELERLGNMGQNLWYLYVCNIVLVKVLTILFCCLCFENIINEKTFLILWRATCTTSKYGMMKLSRYWIARISLL